MTYGHVWPEEIKIEKLELFERKVLRAATGKYRRSNKKYYSNRILYEETNIVPLSEYINKVKLNHMERRVTHKNEWFKNKVCEINERRKLCEENE